MEKKKITIIVCTITALLVIGILFAVFVYSEKPRSSTTMVNIDIAGRVVSITDQSIYVETYTEEKNDYDKAVIKIDKNTMITKVINSVGSKGKFEDIDLQDRVLVVFNGSVAESHPVQAVAAEITVFKNKDFTSTELINKAYNYLIDVIKAEKVIKSNVKVELLTIENGKEYDVVWENKVKTLTDKSLYLISFEKEVNYKPSNQIVVIDKNTKEILGLGIVD